MSNTDNLTNKTPRQYAEEAFWTGHYHYLLQALAVAMNSCLVWRLAETGQPFTLDDLFNFAKEQDEQHPLEKKAFYMVSREGAIGLAPGLEYMVKWVFIPMEKGPERDRLLQGLTQVMQRLEAEEEERTSEPRQSATPQQPSAEAPHFCMNCGATLEPGARFCANCGNPVES